MPVNPQALLAATRCYACGPAGQLQLIKLGLLQQILLEVDSGADVSVNGLLEAARCYQCHSAGGWLRIRMGLVQALAIAAAPDGDYSTAVLLDSAKCLLCYSASQLQLMEVGVWAEMAVGDTSTNALLGAAKCYLCLMPGQTQLVELGILRRLVEDLAPEVPIDATSLMASVEQLCCVQHVVGLIPPPLLYGGGGGVIPPQPPLEPCIEMEDGGFYRAGPFDSFETYAVGAAPNNGGNGWAGPWQIFPAYERTLVAEDFAAYADGAVDGTGEGTGWATDWVATPGVITPPVVATGITLQLESDDFDATADTTPVELWVDKTGLGGRDYHDDAGHRPGGTPFVDAVQTLGGHNTLRFVSNGTFARYFSGVSTAWLVALTAADFYVVMKKDNDPALSNAQNTGDSGPPFLFNRQSSTSSRVVKADGNLYEHFGSSTLNNCGNPATSLTNWLVYNLRSSAATNFLDIWVGAEHLFSGAKTWQPLGVNSINLIGAGAEFGQYYCFGGNLAAIYCFDHILDAGERANFNAYLLAKWGVGTP